MSVIAIAAIGAIVFAYLAAPFGEEAPRASDAERPRTRAETTRQDAALDEIEDLDLEHAAGKIPDAAYGPLRAELVSAAAKLLAANSRAKTDRFCPGCGGLVQQEDKFCPGCGSAITERTTS